MAQDQNWIERAWAAVAAAGLGSGVFAWSLPWYSRFGETSGAIRIPPFPLVSPVVFITCSVVVIGLTTWFYRRFRVLIGVAALTASLLACLKIGSILTSRWWFPGWGTSLLCVGAGLAVIAPLATFVALIAETERFRDHPHRMFTFLSITMAAIVCGILLVRYYWHAPTPEEKTAETEALSKAVFDHYLHEIGAQYTPLGNDERPEIFLSIAREDPSPVFLEDFSWSSIKIFPLSEAEINPFEPIRSRVTGKPGEVVSIQHPTWKDPRNVSVVRCTGRGPLAGWCDLYTLTKTQHLWTVTKKRCVLVS